MKIDRSALWLTMLSLMVYPATARAAPTKDGPPPPLRLELTGAIDESQPYDQISVGLRITNTSGHTVVFDRGISVEKSVAFKWAPVMAIEAVADCPSYDLTYRWHAPVSLEDGAEMDVVPWHGWTCGSQCPAPCFQNVPTGAGTYRFVVILREGERLLSPEFKLPSP